MAAYALGVDLGTTGTAAAIGRGAAATPLQLAAESVTMPSVVALDERGAVVVGDVAERRAQADPSGAAREFKRRVGDPIPVLLGGHGVPVAALLGHLLAAVVARATAQEGEAPTRVVLTHPANWTGHQTDVLREAAHLAGLDPGRVVLLTEPEAAAIHWSRREQIGLGDVVAVYDFGGGTFDAAVLQRRPEGFAITGTPEGLVRLGGIDVDIAVLAHVDAALGGRISAADPADPATRPGQARVRAECRRAKEALSVETQALVPVAVGAVQGAVPVTRAELEAMVRPRVVETVRALERAVASSGTTMAGVSRILLVGGTSRMPVVADTLRAATGRPVVAEEQPKLAVALGAALLGAGALGVPTVTAPPIGTMPAPAPVAPSVPSVPASPPVAGWQAPAPAISLAARGGPPVLAAPRRRRWLPIAVGVAAAVVVAVVVAVGVSGGSSDTPAASATSAASDTTVAAAAVTTAGSSAAAVGRGVAQTVERVALPPEVGAVAALGAQPDGALLVAGQQGTVWRLTTDGTVTQLGALPADAGPPSGVAMAPDGTVLVESTIGVHALTGGTATLRHDFRAMSLGTGAGPMVVDGAGNVYVTLQASHRVARLSASGISIVIGSGAALDPQQPPSDGRVAAAGPLGQVTGLAIDTSGSLLVADATAKRVWAVDRDDRLTTRAGGGGTDLRGPGGLAADGSPAATISFGSLDGLAVGPAGAVVAADATSGALLRIENGGAITVIIARQDGRAAADGVPAEQSSVGALGPLAVDRFGVLTFVDGGTLRRIAGAG